VDSRATNDDMKTKRGGALKWSIRSTFKNLRVAVLTESGTLLSVFLNFIRFMHFEVGER